MERIGLAVNEQTIKEHFFHWVGSLQFSRPTNKFYNAKHFSSLPVLVGYPGTSLRQMRWGLIPEWWSSAKLPDNLVTSSTDKIIQKRALRKPIRSQRCIIPASYYLIWRSQTPFLCFLEETYIFGFAAVFDCFKPNMYDEPMISFSVLKTPSDKRMQSMGNEMPLILSPDSYRSWLSKETSMDDISKIMNTNFGLRNAYPISTKALDSSFDCKEVYNPTGYRLHRKYKNVPTRIEKDRRGREKVVEWKRVYID